MSAKTATIIVMFVASVSCAGHARELRVEFPPHLRRDQSIEEYGRFPGWTNQIQLVKDRVVGDQLYGWFEYRGGCPQHEFKVVVGPIAESDPVQVPLSPLHRYSGKCTKPTRERVIIDLGPLRDKLRKDYRSDHGEANIGLPNGQLYRY
jgi:hypothetical protein